jgi:hypothetical protein
MCIRYARVLKLFRPRQMANEMAMTGVLAYIGAWARISVKLNLWIWIRGQMSSYRVCYGGAIRGQISKDIGVRLDMEIC